MRELCQSGLHCCVMLQLWFFLSEASSTLRVSFLWLLVKSSVLTFAVTSVGLFVSRVALTDDLHQ